MPEAGADPRPAVSGLLPGIGLCVAIAAISIGISKVPWIQDVAHVGALLIVIVIGMGIRSLIALPASMQAGVGFCQKPVLRLAVAGLGFKLSIGELAHVGWQALAIILVATFGAVYGCRWLAQKLGLTEAMGTLLAFGGGICGASAVVAADSIVQSEKSESATALGSITLLGTLGILLYPPIGRALGLSTFEFAVWNGASLQEMAHVVAAAEGFKPDAAQWSTVVKLARVALLAPLAVMLAHEFRLRSHVEVHSKAPLVPWFLVGFLICAGLKSTGWLPESVIALLNNVVVLSLLCIGMAGVGLNSGFQDVKSNGWKPVALSALQMAILSVATLLAARSIPASF